MTWRERQTDLLNRLHARSSGLSRTSSDFVATPEPRTIGRVARGRQIVAGNFLFAGHLVEAPGLDIWDIPAPDVTFTAELHGFGWLDDLAALGDFAAFERARGWTFEWIERFGRGSGPGWTPDLTGRRVLRWISNSVALLNGQDEAQTAAFFASLCRQITFLARRWAAAAPGLPRFEALVGLLCAAVSINGMERRIAPAARALGRECHLRIGAEGGIPSRNPEELLEVFTLLTWASETLRERGSRDFRRITARHWPGSRRHYGRCAMADGGIGTVPRWRARAGGSARCSACGGQGCAKCRTQAWPWDSRACRTVVPRSLLTPLRPPRPRRRAAPMPRRLDSK